MGTYEIRFFCLILMIKYTSKKKKKKKKKKNGCERSALGY